MRRALLAWLMVCLVATGCASIKLRDVSPSIGVKEKPSHTCSGWWACAAQLWLGAGIALTAFFEPTTKP